MSRQSVLAATAGVAFVLAITAACSSVSSHPGNPGLECNPGIPCHIGSPGGVTGNNPADGAIADVSVADAGPNSISLTNCEVHAGTSFTHDPKTDPLDTIDGLKTHLTVGGIANEADVVGGKFSVPVVDAKPDAYAWIMLIDNSAPFLPRVINHILHEGSTAVTIPGPTYFPMYAPDLRVAMEGAVGGNKPLPGTATVIVQLVDVSGTPISGATGTVPGASTACNTTAPPSACGPYYDNGDAIADHPGGTGANGTIVFLAVDGAGATRLSPNFIQVTITASGKPATPLPDMAMVVDAYTFVRHTVK